VTLAGKVAGDRDALVAVRALLRVTGEDAPIDRRRERAFQLATDDGPVEILLTPATEMEPLEERRGTWDAVASVDAADLFGNGAPAPDAQVQLSFAAVRGGDEVIVKGEVVKTADASRGYRSSAVTRPTVVRALLLACGPGARAIVSKSAARAPRGERGQSAPLLPVVLKSVGAAGALVAAGAPLLIVDVPHALSWATLGAGVALTALVLHRRVAPSFVLFDAARLGTEWTVGFLGVAFLSSVWLATFPLDRQMPDSVRLDGLVGWALWGLVLLAFTVYWERVELRTARRVLTARPHTWPPVNGEWGTSEGTVAGTELDVEGSAVACASLFEETWSETSNPNSEAYRAERAPFSLQRDGGGTLLVTPGGLVGAGTFVLGKRRASPQRGIALVHAHVIPRGGRAIVLGRMRGGSLAPGAGAESLVVIGGDDPRRMLRRRFVSGLATLVLLMVFSLGLVLTAVHHPFMPGATLFDDETR